MRYDFGPWEPDSAGVDTQVLSVAKNVYPLKTGYGPIASLAEYATGALPDKCVGLAIARTSAGGWQIFAGTRTKLYKYVSGAWTDFTRVAGGDYNVPTDDFWSWTQFGSQLIFVNFNDDPQVVDVDTGASAFSALGGSPPRARYVTTIGDFVVLGALAANTRKVRNSAINDSTGWTVGTDLCDEQEFADGGRVTGVGGGENGYVLEEKAIRRMIFQPGSDLAFRYERVEKEHGAAAGYSVVATINAVFFLSDDGFYSFGQNGLVPIGGQRVNKWFRDNSDTTRFFSVISFADPYAPRVAWAFYNSTSSTNFDRLLIYDWQLDRWSYAEIEAQYWATLVTAGVTLEDLDTYGDIDGGAIPYSLDSRAWEGGAPVIGAVKSNGRLALLEGTTPLSATLTTSQLHLVPSWRSLLTSVYPLGVFNASSQLITVSRWENSSATVRSTAATAPSTSSGIARFKASGRMHQIQFDISHSSGVAWKHAQGLDIEARQDGRR